MQPPVPNLKLEQPNHLKLEQPNNLSYAQFANQSWISDDKKVSKTYGSSKKRDSALDT